MEQLRREKLSAGTLRVAPSTLFSAAVERLHAKSGRIDRQISLPKRRCINPLQQYCGLGYEALEDEICASQALLDAVVIDPLQNSILDATARPKCFRSIQAADLSKAMFEQTTRTCAAKGRSCVMAPSWSQPTFLRPAQPSMAAASPTLNSAEQRSVMSRITS